MVCCLHDAGIEVMIDVVYNHTAEGNHLGPTLSFKGIDNASYYKLSPDDPRFYWDCTGCGNTLNLSHPRVLQMVMDSLRYWVEVMHVDGFRFDLTSALARDPYDFDYGSGFLDAVRQDPVLSKVKLIAEPWDLGAGGYQVGGFPPGWSEWNGKFRDTSRRYWKGEANQIQELAARLTGSADMLASQGRRPTASVNFITAHDGFTPARSRQLQRQAQRGQRRGQSRRHQRERQLELRRRGRDRRSGRSWSCARGSSATCWPRWCCRRACRCCWPATSSATRSTATTTPTARTARSPGSNGTRPTRTCSAFVQLLTTLRREHPVFRRPHFFRGSRIPGTEVKDIVWLNPEGREQRDDDWHFPEARCLGFVLSGDAGELYLFDRRPAGARRRLHRADERLPRGRCRSSCRRTDLGRSWEVLIDTASDDAVGDRHDAASAYPLEARSLVVLIRRGLPKGMEKEEEPAEAAAAAPAAEVDSAAG